MEEDRGADGRTGTTEGAAMGAGTRTDAETGAEAETGRGIQLHTDFLVDLAREQEFVDAWRQEWLPRVSAARA